MRCRDCRRRLASSTALSAAAGLAVLGLAILAPPAACAPKEDITVALKDKVIRDLSSQGLTLAFQFAITNRSNSGRDLVRYHYRVTVNDREYLNLTLGLDAPVAVELGKEILLALPVKITYDLLFQVAGNIKDRAQCDVVGEMYFADAKRREEKVLFAFPGEFPIFKEPEVSFPPLHLNDLTLGGADVVFKAAVRNLNGYELLVSRISYRLLFGDKEVQAGLISGDKSLPAKGVKEFALPFLLDFFEAGKDLRDLFQKTSLPCRFAGEIQIDSVWGPLLVRFDKTQSLSIEKVP